MSSPGPAAPTRREARRAFNRMSLFAASIERDLRRLDLDAYTLALARRFIKRLRARVVPPGS
ncbi:MAG: hypothetical protein BroJett031_34480 [Betaproteobacteria bacterium]|nr:MAG: hypothetical protein BroJett031_34480 [Betaproteobacteria bacterium]